MEETKQRRLEQTIGYRFRNADLMAQALCHSSYINEAADETMQDNERLEFLGDAVLNLAIGDLLMRRYPELREGDLSRMRAALVNETRLADIARRLDLGSFLQLGKGEQQSNGHDKDSILADAFEALMAAVYLDGGFQKAFDLADAHFAETIELVKAPADRKDHKSRLQELVQSTRHITPRYHLVDAFGPDHDKTFRTRISIGELNVEGEGKNKKAAEQDAARKALDILEGN
jgi:ribonuclease III